MLALAYAVLVAEAFWTMGNVDCFQERARNPCADIQSGAKGCYLLLPPSVTFPHSTWTPLNDRSEALGDPQALRQLFIHLSHSHAWDTHSVVNM